MGPERVNQLAEVYYDKPLAKPAAQALDAGVAAILSRLILRYTYGDSSSVKVETALNILDSIYYAIDASTANTEANDDPAEEVHARTIEEIYESGLKLVEQCVQESKLLYAEIARNKLKIPLQIYNETIDDALPAFFRTYDPVLGAHETNSSIDYPLVFDDMAQEGIFYIRQWLKTLKIETQFCSCFKTGSIHKFLKAYGLKYGFDYKNMPLNLFGVLLDQSIFSILSGHDKVNLTVSQGDIEHINIYLRGKNEPQIRALIDKAVNGIILMFNLQNPVLIEYINQYKTQFASRFLCAYNNGNLAAMVVIDGFDPYLGKIIFKDGEKMHDEKFKYIVDLVQACKDVNDKTRIISSHIHSMEDLADLLGANCLFEAEYYTVLSILGDMELAVLGSTIFLEELSCGELKLSSKKIKAYKKNIRSDWQLYYIDYIFKLDDARRGTIEDLINQMVS